MTPISCSDEIEALEQRARELEIAVGFARMRPSSGRGIAPLDSSRIEAISRRQRELTVRAMMVQGHDELFYVPAGVQTITPLDSEAVCVAVDLASAGALELARRSLLAAGKQPFFDFNHENGVHSFYPTQFVFRSGGPNPGVFARGCWTALGRRAVKRKLFVSFSPRFAIDKRHTPARIVCWAGNDSPNMGGLTNKPAFCGIVLPSL